MIGKTISHYKIIEKLGRGGMGKVSKAAAAFKHDPILRKLRGEKRFVDLMNYAKTQCDQFKVTE